MTTKNMSQLAQEISEKKRYLSELVSAVVDAIASECQQVIYDAELLDNYLQQALQRLPNCAMIYVTDRCYRQISSNVSTDSLDSACRGQDLSRRSYFKAAIPLKGMVLSNIYEDRNTLRPCISLVQAIQQDNDLLGLVIADFYLEDLPLPEDFTCNMCRWQQFKGDPAIRGTLFNQQRITNLLDTQIHKVHQTIQALMINNGVFHFKLHYSSSRVTLWLYDQPHNYRLHDIDDLLSETMLSRYPQRAYPKDACVNPRQLDAVLNQFRDLRFADDNIYLRSASINIINGMVGLNFSCDGTHYIPAREFINNSMEYWLGTLKTA